MNSIRVATKNCTMKTASYYGVDFLQLLGASCYWVARSPFMNSTPVATKVCTIEATGNYGLSAHHETFFLFSSFIFVCFFVLFLGFFWFYFYNLFFFVFTNCLINFRIEQVRDDLSKKHLLKFLKICVWATHRHHRGKFFMSKNVFAYFHVLKDVDSRNQKKNWKKNLKKSFFGEKIEKKFWKKILKFFFNLK